MKECWINVYQYPVTKVTWYGNAFEKRWLADAIANKYLIYRIHVRLK